MLLKGILCICVHVVLFEAVSSQCIPPPPCTREPICATNFPLVEGYNSPVLAPVTPVYGRVVGGNLVLDTSAPYALCGPAGVTIFSDNLIIEGAVLVSGKLPFLGTVGLEGIIPTAGISAVSYGCGTGNIGIVAEGSPVADIVVPGSGLTGCNVVGRL